MGFPHRFFYFYTMRQAFNNCPMCPSKEINFDGIKKYSCPKCGWVFYQNTAAAVAGIFEYEGKYLAVIRNREPAKGMLDFPGGFVDPLESAEEALKREAREELNIEPDSVDYLCTSPNIYNYKSIEYSTCDIFFTAKLTNINFQLEESEIAGFVWKTLDELKPEDFAFRSMRGGIAALKKKLGPRE